MNLCAQAAIAGIAAVLSCSTTDHVQGSSITTIPAFTAKQNSPAGTQDFDSSRTTRATAYVFVGTACPATRANVPRFADMEKRYGPKGIDFVYVYSNKDDAAEAKRTFHERQRLAGPWIDDQGGTIARRFGAKNTTEAFLCDEKRRVLYHGGVDARDYLAKAIDEHLAGKSVTVTHADVKA
jgi:hypothetical protein